MKFQTATSLPNRAPLYAGLLIAIVLPSVRAGDIDARYRELLTPAPIVAEEDNAWLAMQELPERVVEDELRTKPFIVFPEEASESKPMGVDRAWLKEQMEANLALIRLGAEVLKRRSFYRPLRTYTKLDEEKSAGIGRFFYRSKMALAADVARAQDRELLIGWSAILSEMRFQQQMIRSGNLLSVLAGNALLRLAARHAGWIGQAAPDATTAKKLAAELLPFEEVVGPLKATLQGEFRGEQNLLQICRNGGKPLQLMVVERQLAHKKIFKLSIPTEPIADTDPEETEEQWMAKPPATVLDDIEAIKQVDLDAVRDKYAQEYGSALVAPVATWDEFRKAFPEYESNQLDWSGIKPTLGESFKDSLNERSITVPILYSSLFTTLARVRLARLALLVKAWRLDHASELPDSLDQLVPDYIPSVSIDPYDGKPLRYDKTQRRLWSISKSLEGGKFQFEDIVQGVVE